MLGMYYAPTTSLEHVIPQEIIVPPDSPREVGVPPEIIDLQVEVFVQNVL
jgi:hypothetical protein